MLLAQSGRPGGWDPFTEMQRLQAEMNRLFEGRGARPLPSARVYPPVNLWLGEHSVVVTAELPGLSTNDIELTIHEDSLTIQGDRKLDGTDNEVAWHRRERPTGTFSRTIELPFRVDPEKVEARFANGILQVEIQRPAADRPRRIEVTSA